MRFYGCMLLFVVSSVAWGQSLDVLPVDKQPDDRRLEPLRTLDSYFPFEPPESVEQWQQQREQIRRRILVSQGLWPMPTRSDLNAVIHGRVERDDYVVDRVYFESIPGHFVTGSLYRPKNRPGPYPAIASPHGHWANGRFYDAGQAKVEAEIKSGAERDPVGGRYPIQARAVQLARIGCLVFIYDMTGNADSIQINHRPARWSHLDRDQDWGFMSVQADLRLQNMMGLQTWNSIRVIDFLCSLDDVDSTRIGVTGASGGGTQSMILAAIDERIAAAMPCVMVSTAMQGGCTCENAPLLRIGQGNVDIAAAVAPRPLGLTAADDWTIELESKGYPQLLQLYRMLGAEQNLTAVFHTEFPHNYNQVNRAAMYRFFNQHFALGAEDELQERDYQPLTVAEATVWNDQHPAPEGERVGDAHEIRILKLATHDSKRKLNALIPTSAVEMESFREIVGGGWQTILGRRLSDVTQVSFDQVSAGKLTEHSYRLGMLRHVDHGETLPTVVIEPKTDAVRGTIVWVNDRGKAALLEDDRWIEAVQKALDSGYRVVSADLIGQGEFLSDDETVQSQRMWYQRGGTDGWHRFSGYTYGYNHPLFVQRVHDVLTLIKFADSQEGEVALYGAGRVAGPLVAAAGSQAEGAIAATYLDLASFRFEGVERHADPMFVPGSVKYLDVAGLLALHAPAELVLVGEPPAIVGQVYRAAGAAGQLRSVGTREELIERLIQPR